MIAMLSIQKKKERELNYFKFFKPERRKRISPGGIIYLSCFTLFCLIVCVQARQRSDLVNGARCHVRCLTLLQGRQKIPQDIFMTTSTLSLADCQIDRSCADCSRPCEEAFQGETQCDNLCRTDKRVLRRSDCQESCRFLSQVNSIRPGTCPPETQASGMAALCKKLCDNDSHCDSDLKCCSNGCGWTCQHPTRVFDGMPDIPDAPKTVESYPDSDMIELQWRPLSSNTSGHVIYIVEARSDIGSFHNEPSWPRWYQIAQTTGYSTTVKSLKPGAWYQYRIMAVNIYGSRGHSQNSLPYTLSKDPQKPDPPVNLTEGDTLIKDGKISVSIHWSPPKTSDLPVTKYKIFWSKRSRPLSNQPSGGAMEHKETLNAERTVYRIPDLDPNTTYLVQIQAICQHGDIRLRSDKSNLLVTTYPLPFSPNLAPMTAPITVAVRPLPTPLSPSGVAVEKTYYQNGLLRANISWYFEKVTDHGEAPDTVIIYWSLEGCATVKINEEGRVPPMSATTRERFFTIYDLRFDCRYLLRLQSVSSAAGVTGEMNHLFFSTPPCSQVLVIGETQPDCLTKNLRIPGEPLDLHHQFIMGNSNITAKITWTEPISEVPIVSYIIVWGQVYDGNQYLLLDWSTVQSRIVNKEVRSLILSDLAEATTYAVRVQATTRTTDGRVAVIRLTTPSLQPVISDPPYRELPDRYDHMRLGGKHSRNPAHVQDNNDIDDDDEDYDDDDDDDVSMDKSSVTKPTIIRSSVFSKTPPVLNPGTNVYKAPVYHINIPRNPDPALQSASLSVRHSLSSSTILLFALFVAFTCVYVRRSLTL